MASTMLFGNTWVMKSFRLSALVFRPAAAPTSGSGTLSASPGRRLLATTSPISREQNEAATNQPSARRPIRPTVRESPMAARPLTSVVNTSGAMIILIMRRNTSVRMLK